MLVEEFGANIYAPGDEYGGSPMHYACFRGKDKNCIKNNMQDIWEL